MLITLSVTLVLVILCVILHYEAMSVMQRAGDWLHRNNARHRWHLSLLVCGLLIAHVLEVMLFGLAYCGLIEGTLTARLPAARPSALLNAPTSRSPITPRWAMVIWCHWDRYVLWLVWRHLPVWY